MNPHRSPELHLLDHGLRGLTAVFAGTTTPTTALQRSAEELWRFARIDAAVSPPAGAWTSLILFPAGGMPDLLGPVTESSLSQARVALRVIHLKAFLQCRQAEAAGKTPERPSSPVPARCLESRLDDGSGGRNLLLGGLFDQGGGFAAGHTQAVEIVFHAFARAISDRIVQPRAYQRWLLSRMGAHVHPVVPLLLEGCTTPEIAERTGRSPHTVHDHIRTIYRALGIGSRRELRDVWEGKARPSLEPAVAGVLPATPSAPPPSPGAAVAGARRAAASR